MATQVEIDIAKRRYSSDMAAYTFEQFRVARRKYMLAQKNEEDGKDALPDDRRDDEEDNSDDDGHPTVRRSRGVKSTDYATRAPATVNGAAH